MLGEMFLWLVANLKQGVIYFIKQALPLTFQPGVYVYHNKLRGLHLLSQIVKNLSIKTDGSGGLV